MKHGADLNYRHNGGNCMLLSAVAYTVDVRALDFLLENGADLDAMYNGRFERSLPWITEGKC